MSADGLTPRSRPFSAWERALAMRYLRTKRQHGGIAIASIISMVGICLAVLVLIVTMSLMNGFRAEILNRIIGVQGHLYIEGRLSGEDQAIEATIKAVKSVPGIVSAAPVVQGQALAGHEGAYQGAVLFGMRAGDIAAIKVVADGVVSGDFAALSEVGGALDHVALGAGLAGNLGLTAGDSITLIAPTGAATPFGIAPRRKTYAIGAVFATGYTQYDQALIFLPLGEAQAFLGKGAVIDKYELRVADPDKMKPQQAALRQLIGPEPIIRNWQDNNSAFVEALHTERGIMRFILLMVIAIAALSIVSGLIMLVKNKSRDVAILRTIGASRGSITRIFLMVGAVIGSLGAFVGLILGVLIAVNADLIVRVIDGVTGGSLFNPSVYYLSQVPARVEPLEVAIVTVWSFGMALIASILPARWAAKLDPVEALRYE